MIRSLAVAILAVLLGACAGSGRAGSAEDGVEVIGLDREFHQATISSGWVNLRTLELNTEAESPEDSDVLVRGLVTGWVFAPEGEVVGPLKEPPLEAEVEEVWLRLKDRSVHPRAAAGAPPEGACIAGLFDRDTELFYPRDRVIVGARPTAPRPAEVSATP